MKKIIAILLTVAALCLSMTVAVSAAGTPSLSMEVTSGQYVIGSGSEIKLDIKITNNPGLSGIQIYLNKPEWATIKSYSYGEIWDMELGPVKTPVNTTNPQVILNIYGAEICGKGDGVVTTVTFTVDDSKINSENADDGFSFDQDKTYGVGDSTTMEQVKPTLPPVGDDSGVIDVTCTEHTPGAYEMDATSHWKTCQKCGEVLEKEAHDGPKPTCIKGTTCTKCGYESGEPDKVNGHDWGDWVEVSKATCQKKAVHKHTCKLCNETVEEEYGELADHTYGEVESDEDGHWWTCSVCGNVKEEAHNNVLTDLKDGTHADVCSVCAYQSNVTKHEFSTEWTTDAHSHRHVCVCGALSDEGVHKEVATFFAEKKATSTENGNLAYWYCATCDRYFLDSNGEPSGAPIVLADFDKYITVLYKQTCTTHRFAAVPVDESTHMLICLNQCGTVIPGVPHNYGGDGVCMTCGYTRPAVTLPQLGTTGDSGNVEIYTPTDTTTNEADDEGDDTVDLGDTETETKEENPKTGLALSVLPAAIAAAVLALRKH